MSCSHCWRSDHRKNKCPDIDRPHEELVQERRDEDSRFYKAANQIAELLGTYEPEERAKLALEAFRRSEHQHHFAVWRPLMDREKAALAFVDLELKKAQPAKAPKIEAAPHHKRRRVAPKDAN